MIYYRFLFHHSRYSGGGDISPRKYWWVYIIAAIIYITIMFWVLGWLSDIDLSTPYYYGDSIVLPTIFIWLLLTVGVGAGLVCFGLLFAPETTDGK